MLDVEEISVRKGEFAVRMKKGKKAKSTAASKPGVATENPRVESPESQPKEKQVSRAHGRGLSHR